MVRHVATLAREAPASNAFRGDQNGTRSAPIGVPRRAPPSCWRRRRANCRPSG